MTTRYDIEREQVYDAMAAYRADTLPWNHHPKFKGVHLKHLLTGKNTDGRFSYHLVHVEAGCEIEDHIHETQTELHQVLEGLGTCVRGDEHIAYQAGSVALMPQGVPHAVKADEDLFLLATFVPPLL